MSLEDFTAELRAIRHVLDSMDEDLHAKQGIEWRVVDLHHSDATVVLGAFATADLPEGASRVVLDQLFEGVAQLSRGADAEHLGQAAINGIREALKPVGKSVRATRLKWGDRFGEIGLHLKNSIERVSFKNEFFMEEWQRLVEEMNVHPRKPTFRLFPLAGPRLITCEFEKAYVEDYKDALTHKVSVFGKAAYRPYARYPHRLHVEELSVLDRLSDLDLERFGGVLADERQDLSDRLQQVCDAWTN